MPRLVFPAATANGRLGRAGTVLVAGIGIAVLARLLVAPLPSDRTLAWKAGLLFDPAQAQADVVQVEVERPACAPGGTSWLEAPAVTYTPVAVIITIRMTGATVASGCSRSVGSDGRLPLVGDYLTGTYLDVQLTEPLRGRALFDGGTLLPEPRPALR